LKRILILNRAIDQGGIDVVGTELAKFLASCGFETHLAVLFEGDRKKPLPKVSVHSFQIPPSSANLQKLFNLYRRFDAFHSLAVKIQPDVVIAEGTVPCAIIGIDKKFGAPYKAVMTAHNIMSSDLRGVYGKLELRALKFAARYADLWVAVSSSVAQDTKQLLGVRNVEVVYNPVNIPKKSGHKIPGEFVFSAGRLTEQKDFPTLIKAFRIVADRYPKLRLLIAGQPEPRHEEYKKTLEKLIRNLGLKDNVILLGHVSNISDYLASSYFFTMSSIYEGMPIIALEALGIGKAVVATEVPGIKEAVGDAGIYSKISDERTLARNMQKLLSDEKLRKGLEKKALAQARKFSPLAVNRNWIKILEAL
jgi:glycosyltransferase involved in cell wall biosynthesis